MCGYADVSNTPWRAGYIQYSWKLSTTCMYVYSIIMLVNLAALHVMVSLHGSRQNQAIHNVYFYCMKAVSFIVNKLRYVNCVILLPSLPGLQQQTALPLRSCWTHQNTPRLLFGPDPCRCCHRTMCVYTCMCMYVYSRCSEIKRTCLQEGYAVSINWKVQLRDIRWENSVLTELEHSCHTAHTCIHSFH